VVRLETSPRRVCYRCHKPQITCICARVPRVHNRTAIFIVQHPRERFHPIGTERIARLGLERVHVEVCRHTRMERPAALPAGAGLLYPGGDDVPELATLRAEERPPALVVIDGTWAHAHTIFRDNPWLHELPRYSLRPEQPGRYRIRREPSAECVSTIEAIVQALSVLEPDTPGLPGLLTAFDSMIDEQIRFVNDKHAGRRRRARPVRASRAMPPVLVHEPERVLLAYTESWSERDGTRRAKRAAGNRQLLRVSAVRVSNGTLFDRVVRPSTTSPTKRHLECMGVSEATLAQGLSLDVMRDAWRALRQPDDVVLAWDQSTLDMLHAKLDADVETLLLKSVYCNARLKRSGSLDCVVQRESLHAAALALPGRAGVHLANAMSVLELLRQRALDAA